MHEGPSGRIFVHCGLSGEFLGDRRSTVVGSDFVFRFELSVKHAQRGIETTCVY